MRKLLLIAICLSFLFISSCGGHDEDSSTQVTPQDAQYFHPPAWIKGTWSSTGSDPIKYKFTDNDFISILANSETSNSAKLKEIKNLGGTVSVEEIANDNQYYFTMKMNNSNTTYQFKKVTSTQLLWVNHPQSAVIDIYLYKQ